MGTTSRLAAALATCALLASCGRLGFDPRPTDGGPMNVRDGGTGGTDGGAVGTLEGGTDGGAVGTLEGGTVAGTDGGSPGGDGGPCGGCSAGTWCDGTSCQPCTGTGSCSVTTDTGFDGYTPGMSINGQFGWTAVGPPMFDEEIVDDGTGNLVWRVSNAVTSSAFGNQPFSPCPAGTPGAVPSDLSMAMPQYFAGESVTGSQYRQLVVQFRFRSATMAKQMGLLVTFSMDPGQGARMTYIDIEDNGHGLDVYESDDATDGFIARGLSYTSWHTIQSVLTYVEGNGNDVVTHTIDGTLAGTGSSWEEYFRSNQPAVGKVPVQCLLVRLGDTAVPRVMGGGLYIDDFVQRLEDPAF